MMKIFKMKDYDQMSQKSQPISSLHRSLQSQTVYLDLQPVPHRSVHTSSSLKNITTGDLDFSKVTTVNLDEYKGLPRDNDQSYYYFMNDNLFDHVNIDKENTHVPNGMIEDSEKECADYEALIASLGGQDLQLLGLGHNGHIGFNEPADAFDKTTHCVDLTESTIEANKRFFASADEVPRQAYTMGIGTIMQAKKILIVVNGENKADIVERAFFGPVTPEVPASILQLHNDVTVGWG